MHSFWRDVRFAFRLLRTSPGFTAVAVFTLAVGIGANAAIFSLVHATILKPLPFREPSRIVAVWDTYFPQFPTVGVSPSELHAFEQQSDLFAQTAWYRYVPENLDLTTGTSEALEIHAAMAPASLFSLLGVAPAKGRAFTANEDPHSVLLSDKLWRGRFAADPRAIGRTIHLNGDVFTVAGVMPASFHFPDWADVWMPPGPLLGDELTNPVRHATAFLARLRRGATLQQANVRLRAAVRRLAAGHPKTSTGFGIRIVGLQDDLTAGIRPTLLMLLAAVALVLLIACGNIANLLLSRASGRAKEIAIRRAIGAGAWRIVRQLLTESVVLSLIGGALGLLLAKWSLFVVLPSEAPLDSTVFLFLLAISVAAGLLFGLAPALQVLASDPNAVIKSASPAGAGTRIRGLLVVFEFALTIMLVIGAGLLAKSFVRLMHVDLGFNPQGLLTLKLYVPPSRSPEVLFRRMEDRLKSLPGVQSIATVNALPLIGTHANWARFNVPGHPLINPDALPGAQFIASSPDYFQTMQIPLIAGRVFTQRDLSQPVVLINEALARRFWPNRNPIGVKFITGPWGPKPTWSQIVGVVANLKQLGLDSEPTFDLYFPAIAPSYLTIKTAGNPLTIAAAVRHEIHGIDRDIAISDVQSMEQIAVASARTRRWTMALLAAFAGIALLLAIVGLYGVMSWAVAQRRHEIGIRMALGAQSNQIRRMVVRDALTLSLSGIAIGLFCAFLFRDGLSRLVFEVSTADPLIYATVPAAMLIVALVAAYLPARQASRLDPLTALRWE